MPASNDDYYFYLGGIISFTFYLALCLVFVLFIMDKNRVKQIQISSSDYIAVNLNSVITAPPIKAEEPPEQVKEEIVEKQPLETIEIPKQVNTDLSSLFGEVETKELVKRNKTKSSAIDDKFMKKIQKRIETKNTKQVKSSEASSLVKNLKLSKEHIKVVGDSSGVIDEYLAKIHAEVYAKFYPPGESVGKSAKVRLEIDAYGVLVSFRVISYTNDELFNAAVDTCLNALHQFAVHPENKAMSLDIILTAKE